MATAEAQVLAALERIGVPYELIPIDPAYADTAAFCAHYGYPLAHSCNTIIVASTRGPKKYAACVVLATTRLDVNRRVRRLLGVPKASFASAEEMTALTGMHVGGVTPLALPPELPLYVDQRIMDLPWIILGGGGRSLKIKTVPAIFPALGAEIVADLAIA
ncbi:MAG: hypothetical protein KatS3mg131_0984 [Candidatus Tectimicrobiota bacterium]|nr:MAG: hypothetical protein KatS3mg131_0984 [Candidatus Tectomicrobia bacterium]